jgi:hypothetical protein
MIKTTTENKNLKDICEYYKVGDWPDKDSVHSYIEVYSEILSPYRETAKNILEIGLMSGESLRMWQDYFTGKVYGIDCSETPVDGMADLRPIIAEGKHNILIFDACDKSEWQKHFKGVKFDVIIEDAAHSLEQQLSIYDALKPFIADNGIYIIEDIQSIDTDRSYFENIDSEKSVEIVDRRNLKARFDDVLIIIRSKQ